jgi:hypothetical protein
MTCGLGPARRRKRLLQVICHLLVAHGTGCTLDTSPAFLQTEFKRYISREAGYPCGQGARDDFAFGRLHKSPFFVQRLASAQRRGGVPESDGERCGRYP